MNSLLRPVFFVFALLALVGLASAQEANTSRTSVDASPAAPLQRPTPTAPSGRATVSEESSQERTTANESFDLNIDERRITRSDYFASTSVEAGDESAGGLNLRVGVAIGATNINVLLRNVRGQVRFRASLEQLLQRINIRRPPAVEGAAPAPAASPASLIDLKPLRAVSDASP